MNQSQRKNLRERVDTVARRVQYARYSDSDWPSFLPKPATSKELSDLKKQVAQTQKRIDQLERRRYKPVETAKKKIRARANELRTMVLFEDDAKKANKAVEKFEQTGK